MHSELVKKETADQDQLQQLTSAKAEASKAEMRLQELEKFAQDQSKQLAVEQVSYPFWSEIIPCQPVMLYSC